MKNIKYPFILLAALFLNFISVQAHALVIDADAKGEINREHEVKVYYSEFKDGTLEKVADWYSNVADFELWLVKPDGKRIQLSTIPEDDHFKANFTPGQEGAYLLEISHVAEDPGDKTAYQFNAFAQVEVGGASGILPVSSYSPDLVLLKEQQKENQVKNKSFKTIYKGEKKEGITVTVFYPSGKTEELKSDAGGNVQIDLSEKGNYFLEATSYNPDEPGETSKSSYTSVWRVATQKFSVE
ncbi:hypothetical protein [Autumnicola musiva]|uniref:DUF4198 domain-containing protein n=1 Tax=Autumnicola musiva TaxID=3075589 RepID=A0ABU3D826_9FLAO|nr:hypothetical protein [Zunongwangia sp. F117]MDT0677672.1 hypothetical protein [Zunongwangia sp. F117]